eukprot:5985764-Amphidinium_carterae.1
MASNQAYAVQAKHKIARKGDELTLVVSLGGGTSVLESIPHCEATKSLPDAPAAKAADAAEGAPHL